MYTSCFLVSSPSRLKAEQRNIRLVPLKISVVNVVSKCLFDSLPAKKIYYKKREGEKDTGTELSLLLSI